MFGFSGCLGFGSGFGELSGATDFGFRVTVLFWLARCVGVSCFGGGWGGSGLVLGCCLCADLWCGWFGLWWVCWCFVWVGSGLVTMIFLGLTCSGLV